MTRNDRYLITCEHGGNRVPAAYRHLFAEHQALLATHRGYDPGALAMARDLARALDAPIVTALTSRLLVDLNRSIGHPKLHFDTVRRTGGQARRDIVQRYYQPYRNRVHAIVSHAVATGARIVHLSSHSFTPVLDGHVRNADIGLLYDPARPPEVELCDRWQVSLRTHAPQLRVRRNYPYAGKGDGLTTLLRTQFSSDQYVGIELEINQKHILGAGRRWLLLRRAIVAALLEAVLPG